MNALRGCVAGGDKAQATALIFDGAVAQLLEDLAGLEEPYVGVAAVQVVTHHVQQAGTERGAQVSRLFAQRIGDGQRLGGRPTQAGRPTRSEERRVGEEGRSRWAPYHLKRKR